jgi:pilus assembly protein Flp/PilA
MMKFDIKAFKNSIRGAALVEYGMLAGLVSVVAIAAVVNLGEEVESTFSSSASAIATVNTTVEGATPDMNFTINAVQFTSDPNTTGYSRLGSNTEGTISGDYTNDNGQILEFIFNSFDNQTRFFFDHEITSYYDDMVIDCGPAGSLAFNDPSSYRTSYGSSDPEGWIWPGNPLNIVHGATFTCTID